MLFLSEYDSIRTKYMETIVVDWNSVYETIGNSEKFSNGCSTFPLCHVSSEVIDSDSNFIPKYRNKNLLKANCVTYCKSSYTFLAGDSGPTEDDRWCD